jgi:hypothetical protein
MSGGRQIDYRQSTKTKAAAFVIKVKFARIVRSAVLHLIAHLGHEREINSPVSCAKLPDSADATHSISDFRFQIAD